LIRHASSGMTKTVGPLTVPMIEPALGTPLVTGVGAPTLLQARARMAGYATVLLPAVAGRANPEQTATVMPAARTLTQNDFRRVDHSRSQAGLDNARRSCQVTALAGLACFFVERRASGIPVEPTAGIPLLPPVAGNLHQVVQGMRAFGADDVEARRPASVQKTTFPDDR